MEKLSYKSYVQERIFDYWCAFVSKVKKLNVWDLFIFSCDILAEEPKETGFQAFLSRWTVLIYQLRL